MKKEKQPEWLSKHLEENNVEVPIFPETYGFDLGDKYAHVAKVIVDFEGQKYWTYMINLIDKTNVSYEAQGYSFLLTMYEYSGKFLNEGIIKDFYSKV